MLTTSTMPRTPRGVGMNKSKKKKQVSVEPLQEPPNPMSPCDPAAPQVETLEEQVTRVTRDMSPGKSRVVRLEMELEGRDWVWSEIVKIKRHTYKEAMAWKRKMKVDRAAQNCVPKARTKKELAERKEDEEKLADARKRYHTYGHDLFVASCYATHATIKYLHAKSARQERLLRDAGVEC